MKISHYFELEEHVTGGIRQSVAHQRKIFEQIDLQYTTEPTLDADVFHCNLMGPRSIWYAKRARSRGIPVVAHTHVTAEDFANSFRLTNALANHRLDCRYPRSLDARGQRLWYARRRSRRSAVRPDDRY